MYIYFLIVSQQYIYIYISYKNKNNNKSGSCGLLKKYIIIWGSKNKLDRFKVFLFIFLRI